MGGAQFFLNPFSFLPNVGKQKVCTFFLLSPVWKGQKGKEKKEEREKLRK